MFRHSAVYIRTDRGIEGPADLRGKRIGVPEYQMSAVMWLRGFLAGRIRDRGEGHQLGAGRPRDSRPARQISAQSAGRLSARLGADGADAVAMLADGELDAVISARRPSCFVAGHPHGAAALSRLPRRRARLLPATGMFPIMHAVGVRRDVLEKHPWLAASVYKAFVQAKRLADAEFAETRRSRSACPGSTPSTTRRGRLMGDDFWSYGVDERTARRLSHGALFLRAGPRCPIARGRGDVRRRHLGGETRV